jgi:hypothetical protein
MIASTIRPNHAKKYLKIIENCHFSINYSDSDIGRTQRSPAISKRGDPHLGKDGGSSKDVSFHHSTIFCAFSQLKNSLATSQKTRATNL